MGEGVDDGHETDCHVEPKPEMVEVFPAAGGDEHQRGGLYPRGRGEARRRWGPRADVGRVGDGKSRASRAYSSDRLLGWLANSAKVRCQFEFVVPWIDWHGYAGELPDSAGSSVLVWREVVRTCRSWMSNNSLPQLRSGPGR